MTFKDLVFEDVGCCEVHKQAKIHKDGLDIFVHDNEGIYSVTVMSKNGLVRRIINLSEKDIEDLFLVS